jgi:hypothetical protein
MYEVVRGLIRPTVLKRIHGEVEFCPGRVQPSTLFFDFTAIKVSSTFMLYYSFMMISYVLVSQVEKRILVLVGKRF